MSHAQQRAAIVAEAHTWLRTPWHHNQAVKGAGVDCGRLLKAVYVATGAIDDFSLSDYPHDWMLHRDDERFMGIVLDHCEAVDIPLPGDMALWRYFRCFSHGGIVIGWPRLIHAHAVERAVVIGTAAERPLAGRPVMFFRPRSLAA